MATRSVVSAVVLPLAFVLCAAACGSEAVAPPTDTRSAPAPIDPALYPLDDRIHVHHVQMKATHNSYHVATPGTTRPEYRYTHAPLDVQLESQGVRGFEIDVRMRTSDDGSLDVSHIPLVDAGTTCKKFVECMSTLERWSRAHPAHHPIFVQIELKDLELPETAPDYIAALEKETTEVFGPGRLLTPDDVRGDAATLRDAVRTRGWPTLRAARGKLVLYVLSHPQFDGPYLEGRPSLEGRKLFVAASSGEPAHAAVILRDDPNATDIPELVRGNFVVRTRADADNVEPLAADTKNQAAALASGAQVIATDYPAKVEGVDYVFAIPDGTPSRCAPGIAPADCTPKAIEDPAVLASTMRP